jgi:TrmH family RNA methyltransferase
MVSKIRIVLVEPEKTGNIGAIARSMKNFSQDDFWIVNSKVRVDDEAKAYAMHGADVLKSAKLVERLDQALTGVDLTVGTSSIVPRSPSNLARLAVSPNDLAVRLWEAEGTIALLFGREASGLNNEEVEKCDLMVTIPANPQYNVLNIASAASIILYEIFLHRSRGINQFELASLPTRLRLLDQFDRLVANAEIQQHKRDLVRRTFRNLISRSFISTREASLLLGVLRKTEARMM